MTTIQAAPIEGGLTITYWMSPWRKANRKVELAGPDGPIEVEVLHYIADVAESRETRKKRSEEIRIPAFVSDKLDLEKRNALARTLLGQALEALGYNLPQPT